MIRTLTLGTATAVLLCSAAHASAANVTVYPAPRDYPASSRFRVTVEGQPSHVYNAEVAAEQEFRPWPQPMQHRTVGFTYFDVAGPATVEVEVLGKAPKSARVRPQSKSIEAKVTGNIVTARLPGPGNYVVELNHDVFDHLYLFANPLETERPNPRDANVKYFGPGVHEIGRLEIERDGQTVYIAGGAVVKGCLWAKGVNGFRVAGRGLLVGTGLKRGSNMIRPRECRNVRIEDITILDSPSWTIRMEACRGVRIANIRQLSYMQNSDGIDPYSCQDVEIENVFIRNYDDGVVVKAMRGDTPSRNIRTRGSTFITDHGTSLKVGQNETLGPPISDVVFEDCDVLSCRGTPLGLFFNGPSSVSNVRFENIRVEESRLNPMKAKQDGGTTVPRLIFCEIDGDNVYLDNYTPGSLRNALFRDVKYVAGDNAPPASVRLRGYTEASSVSDITLENVRILGNPVTGPEHPSVSIGQYVYNVHFRARVGDPGTTSNKRTAPLPQPTQPVAPPLPASEPVTTEAGDILIEAETGELGQAMARWSDDPSASGGWYVMPKARSNSQSEPPDANGHALYRFSVKTAGTYALEARVLMPTSGDDSFWVKVDDRPWLQWNGSPTVDTWKWQEVVGAGKGAKPLRFELTAGKHTVAFAYREDGAKLDQIRWRRQ